MKIEKYIIIACSFLALVSCSSSGGDDDGGSSAPSASSLVFPADGTECNTGVEVDSETSTVTFDWTASDDTTRYDVVIEELNSDEVIEQTTTSTELEITIKKGTAYQWHVVSKNTTTLSTKSETAQFFNAGDGVQSHNPFPANVASPAMGHSFDAGTTQIDIQWSANDIDDDIESFEVYFGTDNIPATSVGSTADNTMSVTVASGNTYFWKVKTTDAEGNTSDSDIF